MHETDKESGAGNPLSPPPLSIVLLPGLDGTGHQFRRLLECAPDRFELKTVSYPTDVVLDYVELEAMVREQLPEQPYILVGESYSGPLAVALASQHPPHLVGLVLAASFVTPPAFPIWRWLPWTLAFHMTAPTQIVRRLLSPRDEELVASLKDTLREVQPAVLAARVRQTLTVDKRKALAAVQVPILYLQASNDRVVASRCLREVLELQPEVMVKVLDAAHPVLQIDPAGAWDEIQRFVRHLPQD